MKFNRFSKLLSLFVLAMGLALVTTDFAEAKRGFSFGSRGTRTFSAPKTTKTAPKTAPVQRTMTPKTQQAPKAGNAAAAGAAQQKRGLFGGGFMGSMLGGLALGGLIGMMMGNGIGGAAGIFGLLIQGALIFFGVKLLMGFLRSRNQPQAAAGGAGQANMRQAGPDGGMPGAMGDMFSRMQAGSGSVPNTGATGVGAAPMGEGYAAAPEPAISTPADDELGLGADDFDAFEAMLTKVWTAYGKEDYAAIRELTTPEIMGYFAEELGQAASKGLVNEVREIKLLQGDLAESWREGSDEYATVAMRYSSIDVMRERANNKVVEGDADVPEERTELWTFIRQTGQPWKLSAIQQG
ncbi:TIM44-like domain-containing protein [Polycladidibacter hongkongensis]|uniref:TIM44-like domain-containing protein n=1 Tax=Polycladidibacter hongkongensis TaxID=1647556 RepID=UPI00082DD52A|nr:Tim44 domain-containing protein [Pseudovibrio hongkongensis]